MLVRDFFALKALHWIFQIEYCDDKEKVIEDEHDADGGWVDTHHYDSAGSPTVEEKVIFNQ